MTATRTEKGNYGNYSGHPDVNCGDKLLKFKRNKFKEINFHQLHCNLIKEMYFTTNN